MPDDVSARAAKIELLLLDVDGVLSDGGIQYSESGHELKRFHVRDGSGLKFWREAGKRAAILSGRKTPIVDRRAQELGIAPVLQGRADKRSALDELLVMMGLRADQVCAIGDDLPDVPVLRSVGLAIAVADACPEVRMVADYVTALPGGHGAVREAIEWLLKLTGAWTTLVARFTT